MKLRIPDRLQAILYFTIPLVFAAILVFGDFSKEHRGYGLLAAISLSTVWYLRYMLDSKIQALRNLQYYFFFLIKQIPNILQIITFAGFVTYFYRPNVAAAHAITLMTTLLTCLYLTFVWRDYFKTVKLDKESIEKLDQHFRLFTVFLFWLLFSLLMKATAKLLV